MNIINMEKCFLLMRDVYLPDTFNIYFPNYETDKIVLVGLNQTLGDLIKHKK